MSRTEVAGRVVVLALVMALVPVPATGQILPGGPPPNDDYADATTITGSSGSAEVDFDKATTEPGEPKANQGWPSVWFEWTAPATAWFTFTQEVVADDCHATTPVYRGQSLDSLALRSSAAATDIWGDSNAGFVRAEEGETYVIASASTCGGFGPMDFSWERRGPLILDVDRSDGTPAQADVSTADYGGETDALGRVYFVIGSGYDRTWDFEIRPHSLNLAGRTTSAKVPPPTRDAVLVKRRLRALPAVDLDRDGIGDIVSGMPSADRGAVNTGAVAVQFGDGRRRVIDQSSAGVPSARVRGEQFGAAVVAGDVDRDGWPDLVIGSPNELVGSIRPGAVFIVFGSAGGLGNGKKTLRLHQGLRSVAGGARHGDRFGVAVAPAIRLSQTHFVVGVPGKDSGGRTNAGAVVRFSMFPDRARRAIAPSRVWHQGTAGVGGNNVAGDRFGTALAHGGFDIATGMGAWNSPPYASLAIGVPGKDIDGRRDAGAIVVLRGNNRAGGYAEEGNPLVHQNSAVVAGSGAAADNEFGAALVGFRAQVPLARKYYETQTGYDWLAVGAPGDGGGSVTVLAAGNGAPAVFAAAAKSTVLEQASGGVPGANETGDLFGAALAVSDVNDDGGPDVIIGAPGEEVSGRAGAGAATIVYGRDHGEPRDPHWVVVGGAPVRPGHAGVPGGPVTGGRFGLAVGGLDLQADGFPDIAAGAPGYDITRRNAGAVFAQHSSASGLRAGRTVAWHQALANDNFGARLAAPQLFFRE